MNTPTKIIADGIVGAFSGKPVRIKHISLASGSTVSVLSLCSGAAAGTEFQSLKGTVSDSKEFNFGDDGILYPDGCYLNVDANISYATVWWEAVATN